jgi:hypothetical protein
MIGIFAAIVRAVRARPGLVGGITLVVVALSVLVPPLVLSVARKPVDYFTFNPWLKLLPGYLASPQVPWAVKLAKLPDLALLWFSSDSPFGGVEWGFAVDVRDLGRMLLTGLLFGIYFALWAERRRAAGPAAAGVAGMFTGVAGLSTGPCSVMGCGAPVLPVVGLAFTGLSSGTLALLAGLSRAMTVAVLGLLVLGIVRLGWQAARAR